ncbi:MAG: tetratricopeptide repeat protein [Bdellovibrionales bacterium]|jgi:tetratricopeptide (TPR) repeat protein|nr:tetratricopeptide repeat protein [Bdellovibrionales bacterium]
MKTTTTVLALLAFILIGLVSGAALAAPKQTRVEFSRIGDASHFEFEGVGIDRYKIEKKSQSEIVLRLPKLEESSLERLKQIEDGQVKIASINNQGVDGTVEIRFAVRPGIDHFDYVSEQPSRLVLDFFPVEIATKKPTENEKNKNSSNSSNLTKTLPPKKTTERNPAGGDFVIVAKQGLDSKTTLVAEPVSLADKIAARKDFERGIFDGGDPEFRRFTVKDYEIKESARHAARAALRIPFPMLDLGFPKLQELYDTPPIYEILPNETEENKEARLLLTMFKNNRQALTLSTAKDFLKKYPSSEYDEIIRYLMADTHYDLWLKERQHKEEHKIDTKEEANLHDVDFEEAMGIYNNLVEKYPDSPMTTRTLLLVGYSYLERGDSFGALKTFQRFVRLKPDSKYAGQVKISIARAFLSLNRWDDAVKELESVEKESKSLRDRQEASFRKGDAYFRKGDYKKALEVYQNAIKNNPEATGRYPNAYYNMAESRFRLGQEREAIDAYRQFLQKFPEHRHGGYAMTRIGELIETLVGADDRRVTGAFFESYFRYRATPGADIARMRVLTNRMPTMKDRELRDALQEIDEIVKRDGDLPSIQEFRVITVADGFTERAEYDRATNNLVQFYKENTQSKHLPLVRGRIVRNLTEKIRESVDKGDFIQGLRLYSRDQSSWLKGVRRADLPFLAGKAYETAGVYKQAADSYKEALSRLDSQKPEDRDVFEMPLEKESLRLRLAAVSAAARDFSVAESYLKQIKSDKDLKPVERVERAGLAAEVAEARGQTDVARKYLTEMLRSFSEKDASVVGPLHLRIAKLAMKDKDFKQAEASLASVLKVATGTDQEKTRASALETQAEVFLATGKKQEAIASYKALLEVPLVNSDLARSGYDSARYRLGQLLFEIGDLKAAEESWSQLSRDEKSLWRRLANEQMSGAKWRDEYKRYIDRIPAAAGVN